MRTLILLLTLPLFVLSARAAETPATDDQEAPDEYAVELLIFLRDATPGGEFWPEAPERPEPSRAIATVDGGTPPEFPPDLRLPAEAAMGAAVNAPAPLGDGVAAEQSATAESPATRIQPVPAEDYKLTAHAEALRRKGLQPLLHTAWRQVVGDRENKDWLWLESDVLYGLARVSLGRYLHLDTDLMLLGPENETEPRQMIRAVDHRRMRSGELHYIDHPGFGILVQIDRYEPPLAEATPAAEEPLMLEAIDPSAATPTAPASTGNSPAASKR